ncbi:MAG: glycosyltransferase family 1 protein [Chitinophagaceae bacterium]
MKVLFDTQIFDWQINGGISRYFIEVLQRLEKSKEVDVLFSCRHSYNTYIQGTAWLSNKSVLKKLHFKGKLGALKIINEKINRPYSNKLLKKGVPDIFHPTYYDPYFLSYLGKKPLVLTVYDLTNEKFNDNTVLTQKVLDWKKKLILAADHIVSISENTRKDIIEFYKIAPEKITTVYLSGGFEPEVKQAPRVADMDSIPEKFFLFVGSRSAYKNFNAFIQEAAPVISQENISVVVAGGGPMNADEMNTLKKLGIADKVISYSHVSDVFLSQLYSKAMVFIFPSLYEGFGIPVLEAMQCGCPALLSDNSSLPEVGGNAAAYFDPFTKRNMQNALMDLVKNDTQRKRMAEAGIEQAKKFNWDATAQGHIEVYKKIMR